MNKSGNTLVLSGKSDNMVEIKAISGLPLFKENDSLTDKLIEVYSAFQDGDILVIAHTIVSRIEGQQVKLSSITPSLFAIAYSNRSGKDPRLIEVILHESRSIVRMSETLLITETNHGFICANAGVDRSNAEPDHVVLLPKNPDESARKIQNELYKKTGKTIGIVISDTFGRPFRNGTCNVAIGIAGFNPILNHQGKTDLFGYQLQYSESCVADELATAAGLLMGQTNEGLPIILIRGYKIDITLANDKTKSDNLPTASKIVRSQQNALFW